MNIHQFMMLPKEEHTTPEFFVATIHGPLVTQKMMVKSKEGICPQNASKKFGVGIIVILRLIVGGFSSCRETDCEMIDWCNGAMIEWAFLF